VLSGTHVALGREVSTWVHVVKTDESAMFGGILPTFGIVHWSFGHLKFEPVFPLQSTSALFPGHEPSDNPWENQWNESRLP
jgi:hypothetical protein